MDNFQKQILPGLPIESSRLSNILQYIFLLSPIILAIVILFISFAYSNYKGIVYLGFLMGLFLLRTFIYNVNDWDNSLKNTYNSI